MILTCKSCGKDIYITHARGGDLDDFDVDDATECECDGRPTAADVQARIAEMADVMDFTEADR